MMNVLGWLVMLDFSGGQGWEGRKKNAKFSWGSKITNPSTCMYMYQESTKTMHDFANLLDIFLMVSFFRVYADNWLFRNHKLLIFEFVWNPQILPVRSKSLYKAACKLMYLFKKNVISGSLLTEGGGLVQIWKSFALKIGPSRESRNFCSLTFTAVKFPYCASLSRVNNDRSLIFKTKLLNMFKGVTLIDCWSLNMHEPLTAPFTFPSL